MKRSLSAALLWAFVHQATFGQKAITLDDCFSFYRFYPEYAANYHHLADGQHYVDADEGNILRYQLRTGQVDSTLADKASINLEFDQFEFSPDGSKILLRNNTEAVYRHSVLADYFVYNPQTRQRIPVNENGRAQFALFSPDGEKIAFAQNNNLFFKDLASGKTTAVTTDGKKNEIINGLPDWVYEEEFSPVTGEGMVATAWSPDGTKLAYIRFDERLVPQFPLTWYEGGVYPRYTAFKYPKVGSPNSKVRVQVYELASGNTLPATPGSEAEDLYLPRIKWTNDNRLCITRLNRLQNELQLLLFDPAQNQLSPLHAESEPAAYVEIHDNLIFLQNGRQFLWTSERDGYNHVYLFPLNPAAAQAPVQLTKGNFDVTAFYGLDEKNGKFYYQTATPTPMDRQVWEGALDGAAPRLLTPGSGANDVSFSPSFDYFTRTWSDQNTPPLITLCNRDGSIVRTLTDNARLKKMRNDYGFASREFWSFKLADGIALNGWMLKPRNFNPTQKYPVLFDVYGGPGSQTVQDQYDGYIGSWHQLLAQKGYIIVSLDNRGTGARGRVFKKCTQLQLGKLETEDQIAAARYLSTLPYVDPNRIGIWGWSFGGYLSTSCILKGADVFKMAMAVAPVTNWKWYDSAYTERYMHTMLDNARGYEDNSPVNFASSLRGSNYLICHGIADDNVHWQQTTEMINALIRANKQFETYYYPNRNHGISGDNATRHLFTKLTDFVLEKL